MSELTVAIIVKNPPNAKEFLETNRDYLQENFVIVVDSGGGESYEAFADIYEKKDLNLTDARKYIISLLQTPYVLILDADVIIPQGYPEAAIKLFQENRADAVSIFYEDVAHCQGGLEFGCSIWKTRVLQSLYDFSYSLSISKTAIKVGPHYWATLHNGWCECMYMWRKIKDNNLLLETLPYRAVHLKGFRAW